jgi:hypothetical protein
MLCRVSFVSVPTSVELHKSANIDQGSHQNVEFLVILNMIFGWVALSLLNHPFFRPSPVLKRYRSKSATTTKTRPNVGNFRKSEMRPHKVGITVNVFYAQMAILLIPRNPVGFSS